MATALSKKYNPFARRRWDRLWGANSKAPSLKRMVPKTMSIETDFPDTAKLTYLNAASVALMPRSAADCAEAWHRDIAENGTQNFDEVAEDRLFDEVRRATLPPIVI